jgi:ribosomal protein L34
LISPRILLVAFPRARAKGVLSTSSPRRLLNPGFRARLATRSGRASRSLR